MNGGRHEAGPRVVAIVASPRANGNTSGLVDIILEELTRHGADCEKLSLGECTILPCEAHENCAQLPRCVLDDDGDRVLDAFYSADAVVLATPVYYEDVSAQMKLFIDRTYHRYNRDELLAPAAIGLIAVAAETGVQETIDALKRFIALSSNGPMKIFELGGLADKAGEALTNGELVEGARRMAHQIAAELTAAAS
jgi:multimeric flavodoxin WrbA